jgi:DNA-binding CsgD family transcriptional regulator
LYASTRWDADSLPVVRGDEQVAKIRRALTSSPAVVISGAAGVGKSIRLQRAIAKFPNVVGQSLPSLSGIAYGPICQALQHWMTGSPDDVAAEIGPHLDERILVLEDIQWADAETLELLPRLVGRVKFVATTRDENPLAGHPGVTTIEIAALGPHAAHALARRLHPELDDSSRRKLVEAAAGNPLLLRELVDYGNVSHTLAAALEARLSSLSGHERHALALLALLGKPAPAHLVIDLDLSKVGGLLIEAEGLVRFNHSLVADTVLNLVDDESRRRLHNELASRLADADAARHHLAAGNMNAAAESAERAADGAAIPQRAELLSIAVRARAGSASNRLRLEAASALLSAYRPDDAEVVASAVDGSAADLARAGLYRSQAAWLRGDVDEAALRCDEALKVLDNHDSGLAAALTIERACQLVRTQIGNPSIVSDALNAVDIAERSGIDRPRARNALGLALAHTGQPGWEEHFRSAANTARHTGDTEQEFAAAYWLVSAYGFYGPIRVALELSEEMMQRTGQLGFLRWHNHFVGAYTVHRFGTGTASDNLIPIARRLLAVDPLFRNRAQVEMALAIGLIDRGRFADAEGVIEDGRRHTRNDEDRSLLCVATSELAWARNDRTALRHAMRELAACHQGFFGMNAFLESAAIYSQLADPDIEPVPRFPSTVMPTVSVVATEHDAFDRWRSGDAVGAIGAFAEAADEWSCRGFERFSARARFGAGEVARLSGVQAPERYYEQAQAIAVRWQLVPILRSLRAVRTNGRVTHSRAALSRRERQVLELVGDGLSTDCIAERLGLRANTVESHVGSARRKLGASTRTQAAAMILAGRT